jgi:tetratricopeptide (TPR) repeat protein
MNNISDIAKKPNGGIEASMSRAENSANIGNYLDAAKNYMNAAIGLQHLDQIQKAAELYKRAGEYFYRSRDKFSSALAYCNAAQLYGVLRDIVNKRWCYDFAGVIHQKNGSYMEAAYCFYLAAQACLVEDELENAGVFYDRAAKLMQQHNPDKVEFIFMNHLNSALAYAGCGKEQNYKESYSHFKTSINKKGYDPKDNFYFDKLIKALADNGLDDLAGKVYVEKMNLKVNDLKVINLKSGVSKLIYQAWGKTSDYGENWPKWMLYSLGAIMLFSLIYFPNPWGYGLIELNMNRGFKYPVMENFIENIIMSTYFSVTVFSTLGFGDIAPANWLAELVVIIEVLLGYAFLAIFITLISRKLMRR